MKINKLVLSEHPGGDTQVFSFEAGLDTAGVVAGDGVIVGGDVRINRVQQLATHAERLGLAEADFKLRLHQVINEHLRKEPAATDAASP